MITQEQAPIFTNYGPLATQYLTGGQMGYMPQAQYLTPAEYGAFRTLPGPAPTNYQNQMPGLLQSWMIRNYGAPFGLPKYTFNTYNPAVNQQQYMSNIRRHSGDPHRPPPGFRRPSRWHTGLPVRLLQARSAGPGFPRVHVGGYCP